MSVAKPLTTSVTLRARTQPATDRRFYLIMAIVSATVVFLAFARTYYLKAYFGTPQLSALVEIHGFVLTTWMVLFVAQTALIASNRPRIHRRLGYAGGVLAIAVVVAGTVVAFSAERLGHHGTGPDADTVFLFSLCDIVTFTIFVGAGFLWRRNREAHMRLMLLAVVAGLLSATIIRLPVVGGHLPRMTIAGLSLLFAGPVYDLISRRRIHPAYIWGCLFALVTGPPIRIAIAHTAAWHSLAQWLIRF